MESLDRQFVYFLQSDIRGKDDTLYRDRRISFMSKNASLVKTLEIGPVFFLLEVNENEIDAIGIHDNRRQIFYIEEKIVILQDYHTEENLFEYPDHLYSRQKKDDESSH